MNYIMWFHNKSQPCKIGLLMLSHEIELDFVESCKKKYPLKVFWANGISFLGSTRFIES